MLPKIYTNVSDALAQKATEGRWTLGVSAEALDRPDLADVYISEEAHLEAIAEYRAALMHLVSAIEEIVRKVDSIPNWAKAQIQYLPPRLFETAAPAPEPFWDQYSAKEWPEQPPIPQDDIGDALSFKLSAETDKLRDAMLRNAEMGEKASQLLSHKIDRMLEPEELARKAKRESGRSE